MKKMIVLMMALAFALGVTAMAFAQPAGMPLSAEEKAQVADTKKKATKKHVAPKEGTGLPSTLGPEEKQDIQEAKKKSTAEKRKEKKMQKEAAPAAPAEKK